MTAYKNSTAEIIFSDNVKLISTTGYRMLLVFKSLLEKDLSIDELNDIIKSDPLTGNADSADTLRICINSLRNAGCSISRPAKSNRFKYHLNSHPFTFTLTDEQIDLLIKLRENISSNISWQDIVSINLIYSKIISLTKNYEQIKKINDSALLFNLNNDVIHALNNGLIMNRKIVFEYLSPEFGHENIEVVPKKLIFENRKLYLKCFIFKYNSMTFLDTEKIIKIKSIGEIVKTKFKSVYDIVYQVGGDSAKFFEPKDYETVLKRTADFIEVKATMSNDFCFIQRLLLFGSDFKIISPLFFREKLLNKLNRIQRRYS